jgi:tRNA (guanosine-2'-O-)-methyltransferase
MSASPRSPAAAPVAVPSDAVDPEIVCQALAPFLVDGRRERIDETVAARLGGLTLLIENLHDPHNGAAVLRSAEAFGIQTIHVVEATERFRFSSDVSQGCEKWLDVERHRTLEGACARLRESGFALYAAVPGAEVTLADLDFSRPAAIMVGNEHAGLTRSLNLSVASALIAFHASARRRQALNAAGDLDPATRLRLRARFYAASVRGADAIVARYLASSPPHTGG